MCSCVRGAIDLWVWASHSAHTRYVLYDRCPSKWRAQDTHGLAHSALVKDSSLCFCRGTSWQPCGLLCYRILQLPRAKVLEVLVLATQYDFVSFTAHIIPRKPDCCS